MNRGRYEGYRAVRHAAGVEALDDFATGIVEELAEGLLLARDEPEADAARDLVPESLGSLVDRGDLTRRGADRLWLRLKGCGPSMVWPPSWDRTSASPLARLRRLR
jgi:hypothetical protein